MHTTADIRQSFLDFFKSKHHTIVPSASLMPTSPNLLFTNAGMNPFVPYFLGEMPANEKRIANTQKCIRAGGKHNDLEDVGFDTYHHTFFEMLGNWSFGDYFKKESIEWGWELITKVWKFPKERLYATVYKPGEGDPSDFDHEAYAIWEAIFKREGLDPSIHICYGNKKDNFWMMGDTGPCGPCSEIHVDLTPHADSQGKLVNQDSPYCIEIWNHVFIQFNAQDNGQFVPLAQKHVDTGMGLERVAGIIANTKNFTDFSRPPSNYENDLFQDLFKHISAQSGHIYSSTIPKDRYAMSTQEMNDCIFRVLADHIRTLSFSIADGILPGNEGRNYVLRRILRRAVMFGKRLHLPSGFFSQLAKPLIDKMGPAFPELINQQSIILKVLENEEKAFEKTLDRGLQLLDKITQSSSTISGEDAFLLYDTYGFPIDLTGLIARERSLHLDTEGFELAMEKQRSRARAAHQKTAITVNQDGPSDTHTVFVGYDMANLEHLEATVLSIIKQDNTQCLILDKTNFYAEMGGQAGDKGLIDYQGQSLAVTNTLKNKSGAYLHILDTQENLDNIIGKKVTLHVDTVRRNSIQRNHTATHLLHHALRHFLGTHVHQAGSLVAPDYLRFDFAHFEALSKDQLLAIETWVNQKVLENAPIRWYEVPFSEKPKNCLAFFGEKYGSLVRVVDIGGYSLELCGGTHTTFTGEIGLIKIVSESAIAAGTRRLEAITGQYALSYVQSNTKLLHTLSDTLSTQPNNLEERLHTLLESKSTLEKQLRSLQQRQAHSQIDKLKDHIHTKENLSWLIQKIEVSTTEDLKSITTQLNKQIPSSVIVLAATIDEKVSIMAMCSPEAIQKGYKAGAIVQEICAQLGGKGGGKPDFAMGGAKDSVHLVKILQDYSLATV